MRRPSAAASPAGGDLHDYVTLTKPRVMSLLLLTGGAAAFVGASGVPAWGVFAVTMVGLALACGGAAALNHYLDRDIDQLMGERTANRPVASGRIRPAARARVRDRTLGALLRPARRDGEPADGSRWPSRSPPAGSASFMATFLASSLPLEEGDRIVSIEIWDSAASKPERRILHDYHVWREELKSVQEISAFRTLTPNLIAPGATARERPRCIDERLGIPRGPGPAADGPVSRGGRRARGRAFRGRDRRERLAESVRE